MIRFVCSSNLFEKELRNIMDFEIDYLSPTEGILYIESDDRNQLDLFCVQMAQEKGITLTCLECYAQDELTTKALSFAHRLNPNKVHRLSTILFIAIIQKNQPLLDEMISFVRSISPVLLDFARAYIDNGGNAIKTSTHLFVHRNTINNRLNQFYDETKMDLRDTENVKALEIILNYQLYS